MNSDATHRLARPHARADTEHPRDIGRWAIPFCVVTTAVLWVTAAIVVADDRNPAVTTDELAVCAATAVVTVSTVILIRDYLIHRALAKNCRLVRDDLDDVCAMVGGMRAWLAADAVREINKKLDQIAKKQRDMILLQWQQLADEALADEACDAPTSDVIPFGRRRS